MSNWCSWSDADLRERRGRALRESDHDTADAIEREIAWRQHRRHEFNRSYKSDRPERRVP